MYLTKDKPLSLNQSQIKIDAKLMRKIENKILTRKYLFTN